MEDTLIHVMAIVIGVATTAYAWKLSADREKAWGKAARRLGLEFEKAGLFGHDKIVGSLRGKEISARMRRETRGGSRNRRRVFFTVATAELEADCWKGLKLKEQKILDRVATFFGGEDRKVGHQTFDDDFRITGFFDKRAKEALKTKQVQEAIYQLSRAYGALEVEDGVIQIECKKRVSTAGEMIRRISRVVDAAEAMDRAVGVGTKRRSSNTAGRTTGWSEPSGDDEPLFPGLDSEPADGPPEAW